MDSDTDKINCSAIANAQTAMHDKGSESLELFTISHRRRHVAAFNSRLLARVTVC